MTEREKLSYFSVKGDEDGIKQKIKPVAGNHCVRSLHAMIYLEPQLGNSKVSLRF